MEVSCPVSVMKFRLTARIEARGNARKKVHLYGYVRARAGRDDASRARARASRARERGRDARAETRVANVVRLVRVGERVRERRAGARSRTSARCRARGLRGVSGEW